MEKLVKVVQYLEDGKKKVVSEKRYAISRGEGVVGGRTARAKRKGSIILLPFEDEFPDGLLMSDFKKLVKLGRHMNFSQVIEVKRGKAITREELYGIIGVGERQAKRYISKLKRLGIMKEIVLDDYVVRFLINPIYITRCDNIQPLPFYVFREYLEEKITMENYEEYKNMKIEFKER